MDRQSEAVYQWTDNQKLYINGQTSEAVYQWTDNQKCISMDRQSEAVYQWTDNQKLYINGQTMTKTRRQREKQMIYKTLHRKLNIE
jgi:hypothetical protein